MERKRHFSNIREVARIANVSISTVSRVLNHPELTSEKMRNRVNNAIKQCSYTPNIMTTRLISGKSRTIALFALDVTNPFYTALQKELMKLAYDNDYGLIICEMGSSFEKEKRYYEYCKSSRVDGIIYTAGPSREKFLLDDTCGIPLVMIDHEPFSDVESFIVHSDNDKMIRILVNYLVHLKHERIAFVSGPMTYESFNARYEAYKKYMVMQGLEIRDEYIYFGKADETGGMEAFDYFCSLPTPPTAVISVSDQIAHGFILRAIALGIKIPDDYSVCSVDAVGGFFYPVLTSVRQNIEVMAEKAFNYLIGDNIHRSKNEEIIDVSFQQGQTCRKLE